MQLGVVYTQLLRSARTRQQRCFGEYLQRLATVRHQGVHSRWSERGVSGIDAGGLRPMGRRNQWARQLSTGFERYGRRPRGFLCGSRPQFKHSGAYDGDLQSAAALHRVGEDAVVPLYNGSTVGCERDEPEHRGA